MQNSPAAHACRRSEATKNGISATEHDGDDRRCTKTKKNKNDKNITLNNSLT